MDRGAWPLTTVHGFAKSRTQLKRLSKTLLCTFGCAGSSLLPGLFSRCGKQSCCPGAMPGLLTAVASLAAEHGLWARGLQQLQILCTGSLVVEQGLAAQQLLDQGLNPCLLHWKADSLSLSHRGSLQSNFLFNRYMSVQRGKARLSSQLQPPSSPLRDNQLMKMFSL